MKQLWLLLCQTRWSGTINQAESKYKQGEEEVDEQEAAAGYEFESKVQFVLMVSWDWAQKHLYRMRHEGSAETTQSSASSVLFIYAAFNLSCFKSWA